MSTTLKRLSGILLAGVALSLAIITMLPGIAEAQNTDGASTEAKQNATDNQSVENVGDPAGSWAAPEPSKHLVVPGDSLWSIGQQSLGSGASPDQIAYEAERIFWLNQDLLGDNPNLILPGQELLLAPVTEPPVATIEPPVATIESPAATIESPTVTVAPTVAESPPSEQQPSVSVDEPVELPGLPSSSPAEDEAVPAASSIAEPSAIDSFKEFYANHTIERPVLGLGIILLTLVIAILMAWRLPMNRGGSYGVPRGAYHDYFSNYALPTQGSGEREEREEREERKGASASSETRSGSASGEVTPQRRPEPANEPVTAVTEATVVTDESREAEDSPEVVPKPIDLRYWVELRDRVERLRPEDIPPEEHEEKPQRSSSVGRNK